MRTATPAMIVMVVAIAWVAPALTPLAASRARPAFVRAAATTVSDETSPDEPVSDKSTDSNDAADPEDKPAIRIKLTRGDDAGDRATITAKNNAVAIDLHSKRGIGGAVVTPTGKAWPNHITLRLHLRGLENLTIRSGDVTLAVAVSSTAPHTARLTLTTPKLREQPVAKGKPYWTDVRLATPDDADASIPLKEGHFELNLPADLFKADPKRIDLRWIDFYR